MNCPECSSNKIVKNGSIHNGKRKYKCKDCGRQFVPNPEKKMIPQSTWIWVINLLLERIPLAGISRVTGISKTWLQKFVNEYYENIPKKIENIKQKGRLTLECDEMWSFVFSKANKYWIWLAIDRDTREIVGVHVGSRDRSGAQALWDSLPGVYRQCAVCYTDFWSAYGDILPSTRHRSVGKESGETNHIERFNLTMRQRVSRLVRKTLSFSKKVENHVGAIWDFVHHYNSQIKQEVDAITTC